MINEEVTRHWLIEYLGPVLRVIINESAKVDYDFTKIVAFYNHKEIQEKRYQK